MAEQIQEGAKKALNYVFSWVSTGAESEQGKPSPKGSVGKGSGWVKPSWPVQTTPGVSNWNAMIPPAARFFVQLAGVSGAAAVILGAYGAHAFKPSTPEAREVFDTGNRYHLIHSVALGLAPFSRHPKVTGLLFALGMLGFCGSCYGYSLAQSQTLRQMAPYGGVCLILAWLSLIF